jgi:hypothetical protein
MLYVWNLFPNFYIEHLCIKLWLNYPKILSPHPLLR